MIATKQPLVTIILFIFITLDVQQVIATPRFTEIQKLVSNPMRGGLGEGIDVDGDTLVVSGLVFTRDDNGTPGNPSDDTWTEQKRLLPDGKISFDLFGWSAAVAGDAIAVGAPAFTPEPFGDGSVYVYRRTGETWAFEEKLVSANPTLGGGFGASVAMSGPVLVVGAPGDVIGAGRAYVFRFNITTSTWDLEEILTGENPQDSVAFGVSVAIENDLVVVGATGEDDSKDPFENTGAAYIFRRDPVTLQWVQEAKLSEMDTLHLGSSVVIDSGRAYIGSGRTVAPFTGVVFIYQEGNPGQWVREAMVTASDGNGIGGAVSALGDKLLVRASSDSESPTGSGSALLFTRHGTKWFETAKFLASDAAEQDRLGWSLTLNQDAAFAGSFNNDGATYVFDLSQIPSPIPATSTWGLIILTLATTVTGSLILQTRRSVAG